MLSRIKRLQVFFYTHKNDKIPSGTVRILRNETDITMKMAKTTTIALVAMMITMTIMMR